MPGGAKDSLPPFPGSDPRDDLRGVVTHLTSTRTRSGSKERDPNEPGVRWLLESGLNALEKMYVSHDSGGRFHGYDSLNALFASMTMDRVMAEFETLASDVDILPVTAHKSRIISRWEFLANFQADLVAYIFRPSIHRLRIEDLRVGYESRLAEMPFGDVFREVALWETAIVPDLPIFRIQTALPILFPNDTRILEASDRLYRQQMEMWAQMCGQVIDAYGLTLIPEVSLTDLATMLRVVVDGGMARMCSTRRDEPSTDTPVEVRMMETLIAHALGRSWSELAHWRQPGTSVQEQAAYNTASAS